MESETGPDSSNTGSTLTAWPGERVPTRDDVDVASDEPGSTFIDGFASALFHSERHNRDEVSWMLDACTGDSADPVQTCTYPVALLSDVPALPSDDDLTALASSFSVTFRRHLFLNTLKFDWSASGTPPPPYLELALAYLAAACEYRSRREEQFAILSSNVFRCGVSLWPVMVEVDNRQARSIDALIAAILLSTFGCVSAERLHWKRASGILCNVVTISRRLHLTDSHATLHNATPVLRRSLSQDSTLIGYMLMVDVVQGLHFDSVPNYSSNEFFIDMPNSRHAFRKSYGCLVGGHPLPSDVNGNEDALLLVLSLLSDIIRTYKTLPTTPALRDVSISGRPPAPLTVAYETACSQAVFAAALARWRQHFPLVSPDILMLHHIAELLILVPGMCKFPRLAGYPHRTKPSRGITRSHISEKAADIAWRILDASECCRADSTAYLSIWLPVSVFLAALVVWQHLEGGAPVVRGLRSTRALTMFTKELERLHWPCCTEMIATINNLNEASK